MVFFIIRRLLTLLVNLLVIVCVVFILSRSLSHDPVLPMIDSYEGDLHTEQFSQEYARLSHKMRYDIPKFYFSVVPKSYPDTLYNIPKFKQEFIKMLIRENGHWSHVELFISEMNKLSNQNILPRELSKIYRAESIDEIQSIVYSQEKLYSLETHIKKLTYDKRPFNNYLLRININGRQNQFHIWFTDILAFNWGVSSVDGRSVDDKIQEGIRWTLMINLIAVILIFVLGTLLGVISDFTKHRWIKQGIFTLSYVFYAVPVFWLASLFIVMFTSDSDSFFNWFPPVGRMFDCRELNIMNCFLVNVEYLILPIICLCLPALAYFISLTQSSIIREKNKHYVLYLKSAGFSKTDIYFKYILKNALMPIITLLGQSIPAIMSGSLVIEIIFNIPGTGRLIFDAIYNQDWNVVFLLVIIVSFLTMIGFLISDILYKVVNPKIELT